MSKKKKIILGLLIGFPLLVGLLGSSNSSNSNVKSTAASQEAQLTISPIEATISIPPITIIPTVTPLPTSKPIHPTVYVAPIQPTTAPTVNQSSGLSNDNSYTNVDGNQVHSPAYSNDNSVPAGATAQCGDGTYSFSQHHSGTCSHHGGVASWL